MEPTFELLLALLQQWWFGGFSISHGIIGTGHQAGNVAAGWFFPLATQGIAAKKYNGTKKHFPHILQYTIKCKSFQTYVCFFLVMVCYSFKKMTGKSLCSCTCCSVLSCFDWLHPKVSRIVLIRPNWSCELASRDGKWHYCTHALQAH